MIPRIIHQTWKTKEIPDDWKESVLSWQGQHPGWEYVLWTDVDLERFIIERYPWFAETYRDYPCAIQRVDASRYFILYEYGGIYSDLDIICRGNCDFLLGHGVIIPRTKPLGFSNDLMMAEPKHPFFLQMINNLRSAHIKFSRNPLLLRHFRILLSAGSLYLTRQYNAYSDQKGIYIMPQSLYSGDGETSLVRHTRGNSWHAWDSKLLCFIFDNLRKIVLSIVTLSIVIFIT